MENTNYIYNVETAEIAEIFIGTVEELENKLFEYDQDLYGAANQGRGLIITNSTINSDLYQD